MRPARTPRATDRYGDRPAGDRRSRRGRRRYRRCRRGLPAPRRRVTHRTAPATKGPAAAPAAGAPARCRGTRRVDDPSSPACWVSEAPDTPTKPASTSTIDNTSSGAPNRRRNRRCSSHSTAGSSATARNTAKHKHQQPLPQSPPDPRERNRGQRTQKRGKGDVDEARTASLAVSPRPCSQLSGDKCATVHGFLAVSFPGVTRLNAIANPVTASIAEELARRASPAEPIGLICVDCPFANHQRSSRPTLRQGTSRRRPQFWRCFRLRAGPHVW